MADKTISRRAFAAGSAAVIAAGAVGMSSAFAEGNSDNPNTSTEVNEDLPDRVITEAKTMCNGCGSFCGATAYVQDGEFWKIEGNVNDGHSGGKICARGQAYADMAYNPDKLHTPLKNNGDGTFSEISWDDALNEIGEKVQAIIASDGASAVAGVAHPVVGINEYFKRFISALGSPNFFAHSSSCNLSKESGIAAVAGVTGWSSDVKNAKMTLFLGRSYADGIRPAQLASLTTGIENGSHVVIADPRYNSTCIMADEWLAINPGTDLAFVLAMANVLIEEDRYDKNFIEAYTTGFEEWAEQIKDYTPAWAAPITGLSVDTIHRVATELAEAAPAASIEAGWRGANGCQYLNSFELSRAMTCFNALLGCWNQKGGAFLTTSVKAAWNDTSKFIDLPVISQKKVGTDEYPLALVSPGSAQAMLDAAGDSIKCLFAAEANPAGGYSGSQGTIDRLNKLDLLVVIDVQMSETAALADYILPECTYLEREDMPKFVGGRTPYVSIRTQAIEVIDPETKPLSDIVPALASACGVGEYFDFTLEEYSTGVLESVGIDYETLKREGSISFKDNTVAAGTEPTFTTDSGKIEFSSAKVAAQEGYTATPSWIEPLVMPTEEQLRLISFKLPNHSYSRSQDSARLMDLSKRYDQDRALLNAKVAKNLGLEDGDMIEISNDLHTAQVQVNVTELINPTCIALPSSFGRTVSEQVNGYEYGINTMDYVPFQAEPSVGSAMTHETLVTVKKVG